MTLLFGLFLALLPGFAWLIFYLEESPKSEPKSLVASTFISGGAAAFIALTLELLVQKSGLIVSPALRNGVPILSLAISLLALSFIEEILKFGAAYLNTHKNPDFNRPIDAMIFMIVSALGFATIENLGAILPHAGAGGNFSLVYETIILRFVGATLLHSLTSGLLGYYWAISIRDFNSTRFIFLGIAFATVLHAVFNYLILTYGSPIYTIELVLLIGTFVLHDFEKLRLKVI